MTVFIIVCAVMLLAAILIVVYPLLRPAASEAKGEPALPRATVAAVAIGAFLTLGAAAMYGHSTNFPWQDPRLAQAAPAGHGEVGAGDSMDQVVAQVEARLKANPNDVEGWRMLGRSYVVTGQVPKAIEAYRKAVALAGNDPGIRLDLAEALVLSDDAAQQPEAKRIIDEMLQAEPRNPKALWYSGVIAYRAEDKETARQRWSTLLEQNPPDEVRQILVQQLAQLGMEVPEAAPGAAQGSPAMGGGADGAPAPEGRTIRVAVSVDPSLASRIKPGSTLFVSAREPGIPGPPLAALRLTTDALPTTVVLSDANSMVEGRNLSSVADVEVVARVAFGGSVTPSSGDLLGSAVQKKGGPADLSIAIARVQP